ncbi:hypothetical protein [Barrientosiimonas humi]|uniref:hypothetical protein n=1 Tax=Barrientosiimonas humi TaxID=999931 RepID=UPI00370DC194
MTPVDPAAPTRLAGVATRLLSVHLDGADPRTAEAFAGAIERLAGAVLDWHDALRVGAGTTDEVATDGVPTDGVPGAPVRAGDDAAAPPPLPLARDTAAERASAVERLRGGSLPALASSAQAAAGDLAGAARDLRSTASSVAAQADSRVELLAASAGRLAESVAELGATVADERDRAARGGPLDGGSDEDEVTRAASALRRAERAVEQVARTTLPG